MNEVFNLDEAIDALSEANRRIEELTDFVNAAAVVKGESSLVCVQDVRDILNGVPPSG